MTKNELRQTVGSRRIIRRQTTALYEVLTALTPLDFNERRQLLRWACDYYQIDPARLPLAP